MAAMLTCYACGEEYDQRERARCACGEPLWFEMDDANLEWETLPDAPGLWRYKSVLPIDPPTDASREGGDVSTVSGDPSRTALPPVGIASGAGGTPLFRTPMLDEVAGCTTYLKDEGQNPTGSFKDRGSAVGVTAAAERGRPVGTVSHGNMAMSMAAHAASADITCVVLVPADISETRLQLISQYNPLVIRVDGNYGRLYERSLELGPELGISFVNSDSPLRVAGQATTTLEILDEFAPAVPDALVMPVSSGGHASSAWKALRDLEAAGVLSSLPTLHFVQAASSAPIAAAFADDENTVSPIKGGGTIAYSIGNGDPPSGNRALAAARDTGGRVVAVTDDEIRAATAELAARAGACVEPASATTLAGTWNLVDDGVINADDDVVLVATGTGFKEDVGQPDSPESPTVPLKELEATLKRRID
ncbi:threonine synthase [Halobacterium sp. KA-6]|uniref:threonine synthase n=1 Tax=Halobacterium sp. KA-6 TaxID=2896368 RepID=UPI001E3912D2|nr:threonine synthase [Halobacterium sp. KA-6]MCD2204583.1 threonine synthase [Halobacterium sp. KA-6]